MKIALLSDTHIAARAVAFNANVQVSLAWINTVQPDAVAHLGDITADGMYDPAELELAAGLLRSAGRPVHAVPGNHDIGDNPASLGRPNAHPLDLARLADYRRAVGPDRWSLRGAGWQLIGLNSLLLGTGSQEEEQQFEWLAAQVREVDGPVGLLIHKPLFRDHPNEQEAHDRYVPWQPRLRLLKILGSCDLRFVLSGHVHQARRLRVGKVEHIWLPSTAFCIPDSIQELIGEKVVGVALTSSFDS
jgi:3',5'-cyclic AMP phosphodiesterase CpdA